MYREAMGCRLDINVLDPITVQLFGTLSAAFTASLDCGICGELLVNSKFALYEQCSVCASLWFGTIFKLVQKYASPFTCWLWRETCPACYLLASAGLSAQI
jgi:hypothetical protein